MPKEGYTELTSAYHHQPDASMTTADDADETSPLNGRKDTMNGPASISKNSRKILWVVGTVAAVLLAFILGGMRAVTKAKQEAPPQIVVVPHEEPKIAQYRSLCLLYGSKANARIIQTSMKAPSQQWSAVECFRPERGPLLAPLRERPTVELNAFGAPDAILQVNFSQLAHPDRDIPIIGFGGAFTEASALNFNRLSEVGKETVMELLFGKSGLGYSIGRFHINSCDFSVKSYSFDETVDDFELKDFDEGVHHDVESGMVGMALRAVSKLRLAWGTPEVDPLPDGVLRLYASPWSPPSWMKKPTWEDPKNATHASKMTYSKEPNCLREGVGPDSRYAKAWALYFSKFLTAYSNLGLPLQAITVQNEPEFPAPWEACSYTPKTQLAFVANHLGPVLEKDHPGVKIFIFDHNKDHVNNWTDTLLRNTSKAKKYISGTAYHWYAGGMDRLLDGALGIPNMHRLQDNLAKYGVKKDHIVFGSEACHCPTTGYAGGSIDIYWARAERYAHTILADLAAGSNGWVEWNLILDGIGGPNHLGNLCESTILAVPHRAVDADPNMPPLPDFERDRPMGNHSVGDGRTREELNALGFPAKYLDVGVAVQPIYFYMGHISRYVRPGSVAVTGLVQESLGEHKIFRPSGSVVAGGGENDLARYGIEITLWPCEGSTRQQFKWNIDYKKRIEVYGHDWLGKPTTSCFSRMEDKDLKGLRLNDCGYSKAGSFEALPIHGDDEGRFIIRLLNPPNRRRELCLVIRELKNGGGAYGARGGAQVTLGSCGAESAKWFMDSSTGEISSIYFANGDNRNTVCMTTGWPFLQMGAFLTAKSEASPKTVVILNEANEAANFALKDADAVILTASIPPRTIQTVLVD